jgi:putative membrane protein
MDLELTLYLMVMGICLVLMIAALGVYVLITPYRELKLIGDGNRAAAVALGGTTIGLSLVFYGVTSGEFDLPDLLQWCGIGIAFQLIVPIIVGLMVPNLRRGLEADRMGYGILIGALSVAMGLINSGALSAL